MTTLGLDDNTDVQLSAIAALVRGAVVDDLAPGALLEVYDHPRMLNEISAHSLPGMDIYFASDTYEPFASGIMKQRLVTVIDYVLTSTDISKRESRYPTLRAVWGSVAACLMAGHHAAVSAGANVLSAAGLTVERNKAMIKADFGFADVGRNLYPYFRGVVEIEYYPSRVDPATLENFLGLYTAFDSPGVDPTMFESAGPPYAAALIDNVLVLPAYGS